MHSISGCDGVSALFKRGKSFAFKAIDNEKGARTFDSVIAKIGNLSSYEYVDTKVDNAFSFLVKS